MNNPSCPPTLDAAELYTLALRFIAVAGLYKGSDLRWAAQSLRQSSTDPDDQQVIKELAEHLERMAVTDDELTAKRSKK